MHTHEELVSSVVDLARRVGHRLSTENHRSQERELRSGHRMEVRWTIHDSPLQAVAFLEELRQAAEEAQFAVITEMGSAAVAGPSLTDLGAALSISKQAGRKRAAAAAKWSGDHELPTDDFHVEDLGRRYPAAGQQAGDDGEDSAEPRIHWPVDTSPHPDIFGNPSPTQEKLAGKAFAMGIGMNVNR